MALNPLDPTTQDGIIGEFCRAYTVEEAIRAFALPYSHQYGHTWVYNRATRSGSATIDGHWFRSDYHEDPAKGRQNAFDLVRLHAFGDLDRDPRDDPQPSYVAMVAMLAEHDGFLDRRTVLTHESGEAVAPPNTARHLADILASRSTPEWLLDDILERRVIAVMAGPRGSYKSFIAIDWSLRIAAQGRTVYIVSAEGNDLDRRCAAWFRAHGERMTPAAFPFYVLERRLDLNTQAGVQVVQDDCVRLGIKPDLYVLDTFSKLSGGLEENDNTEVKQFIGRLDAFRSHGASVLLIAHTGHSNKTRARGASALGADTEAEYIVNRSPQGLVSVSRERFKASPELPSLYYRAEVVPLDYLDRDGKRLNSLALREVNKLGRPSLNVGFRPTGAVQRIIWDAVRSLLAAGPMDSNTVLDRLAPCLPPPPEGERDRRRSTARRTLEQLVVAGVLFMPDEEMVSLEPGGQE